MSPRKSNSAVADEQMVIKPAPPQTFQEPGAWMYLCKHCKQPAFVFTTEAMPSVYNAVEELEYVIPKGGIKPRQRTRPVCSQCGSHVALAAFNRLRSDLVFQVDNWCQRRGLPLTKWNYRERSSQKVKDFLKKDKMGNNIFNSEVDLIRMSLLPAGVIQANELRIQKEREGMFEVA